MSERLSISFTLNGQPVSLEVEPGKRALDMLREDCGLLAAKEGCGSGECGACAVLIDNVARLSCLMLAAQLDGHSVVTAEGLGGPDASGGPHPVQTALAACGGVQCGFCSPGVSVTAAAFLADNPDPDRESVRQALSGNLCRCTGYVKIVDAVLDAAATLRGDKS